MSSQHETKVPKTPALTDDPSSLVSKAGPREWMGLALLSLPTVLLGLDLTLLHLTLPALAADLQPTSTQALWIMDAYGFMIAGFLITMGTLGDRIGRRKLLMIGATAFAIASVFAAFSTSAIMLIAARAMLGISAATLMPSTLALISNIFKDPQQRALGFGIWATMFGVGYALGPVVGGFLLELFWWGAAFLIAVPIVGLLLILSPILLPEYRAPNSERLDLPSVALSLALMLPVIYGIKQIAKHGIAMDAFIAIIVGLVFAVLFVRRQRRLVDPLLDLSLFVNKAFSVALIVLLVGLIAVGGAMLLVAQYLQLVAGYSPFGAGLWMGLAALAMIVGGVTAPLIARHIRPGYVVAASLVLSAIGYILLAIIGSDASPGVALAVAGLALAYLGNGTIAALGTDLVVGSAPPEKAGSASAMTETVQDLGISLGIALLGSISSAAYRHMITLSAPEGLSEATHNALSDSLWAALAVQSELPAGLIEQAQAAFTKGFNDASAVSAVSVVVLAFLSAVALRHVGKLGQPDD
ncbi:DHA2 family multidrug resistance protein-like MFS transporter [Pseudaminobacter salicylatoxidans]|uniref:DHA2 family multidrug resistance protein-like MFS transporter n=1 Tax=Pseudaminobacter salicylatoxidans TaxID=93369 RepID=A0A316C3D3_PSESE|nr:MFS transporter [Pseudaminobacter salicylatoxidans]PWJ83753.1 DHA2 family multidrug resistance protein-like MFS transporter [Pseudaminobacter salicylatoxidans]